MDDDDLGDLAAIMGDDYGHGVGDEDGDPNVKPKRAPAPLQGKKSKQDKLFVKFPAQKQFLTKLVVECMPISAIEGFGRDFRGDPFAGFTTSKGRIVQPKDPINADHALFENLNPAEGHIFRLVCTNPSGTSRGAPSKIMFTLPRTPPAPELNYATGKSVSIRFPAQGPNITKLSIEMAVWCADPFGPDNKKKGMLTDTSPHIDRRTSGLVRNLKPGTAYVFRLLVTNQGGTVAGPPSKPIKTLPRPPPAPREDISRRTDKTVTLKWDAFGTEITSLALQYAILSGKTTFTDLKKHGGREIKLSNPQETGEYTVKNLKPETNYVFRLVAANSSGKSTGAMLGPIKTVTFSPEMMDKSGWMFLVADGLGKPKARGSIRKKGPPKYWFTLDAKLLTWNVDIDGAEVDYLHLGKVTKIEVKDDTVTCVLRGGKGKKAPAFQIKAFSDNPNKPPTMVAEEWGAAIDGAIKGEMPKDVHAEMQAAIAPAAEEELDEDEEGGDGDGFEQEEGFGDFGDEDDDEDFGDFGGVDEEEGEGGFGAAFDEAEEEDTGFGGADEDEEATGFE